MSNFDMEAFLEAEEGRIDALTPEGESEKEGFIDVLKGAAKTFWANLGEMPIEAAGLREEETAARVYTLIDMWEEFLTIEMLNAGEDMDEGTLDEYFPIEGKYEQIYEIVCETLEIDIDEAA